MLLGPFMAIARPIAAVASAIVAGLLVGRDEYPLTDKYKEIPNQTKFNPTASSCCSIKKEKVEIVVKFN